MTLPIVLTIAGCIALLVGLFGGGVKAKEIEVPKISVLSRIFSSLVGVALIWAGTQLPSLPDSLTPTETVTPILPTATSFPSSTADLPIVLTTPSAPPTSTPITPTPTFVPSPTNIPPTQVPPTAIPPTLEPPVGSEEWRQQLEPLWDGTISSVLIVGKFRRQSDLVGLSLDDQRNILITELGGRTNQSGGYYQSLDNDTLAGAGALLVFVRAAKIRNDQDLKTITDDDIRNIFIVEIYARTGRADLQGLSNIQLVRLALSLQW